MGEPFIGEIRTFGFNFAPAKWAKCDGQVIPISQNPTLYSLLGTNFGGNGSTNFGLPDLRGRTPINRGQGMSLAQKEGYEDIVLTPLEMPKHTHVVKVSTEPATSFANFTDQYNAIIERNASAGATSDMNCYHDATDLVEMADATCTYFGGNQGHPNMQPTLVINFCIALEGTYPPRN